MQRFVSDFMQSLCPGVPQSWLGDMGCALADQGTGSALPLGVTVLLLGVVVGSIALRLRGREVGRTEVFLYSDSPPVAQSLIPDRRRPHRPPAEDPTLDRTRVDPRPPEPRAIDETRKSGPDGEARDAHRPYMQPERTDPAPAITTNGEDPDVEGTLQLLPGRLEPSDGTRIDGRSEIRFVRVPGTAPEVTIGRGEGPPHRHIRLGSPTVSRLHARMRFDGLRWSVVNESTTNPTRLNGRSLDAAAGAVPLSDGDRIEIGEVGLTFRQEDLADRLPLRSSWYTDRGRRSANQDAVAVRALEDGREVAVVCDGMGGHAAGSAASHTALEAFMACLEAGETLESAVQEANRAVLEAAGARPNQEGMGTTLVALLRAEDEYSIVNVGDSRAYRVDSGGIRQITDDHSFVAEAVRDGRMSKEEAERSPWASAVTRNLGAGGELVVDSFGPYSAREEHVVILCSDGLHGPVADAELEALVRDAGDIRDIAREAGERALRSGGEDNVSVVALSFGATSGIPTASAARA